MPRITLYHGTARSAAEKILQEGFASPTVYLTPLLAVAEYYGAEAAEQAREDSYAILRVTLTTDDLYADPFAFEEPVRLDAVAEDRDEIADLLENIGLSYPLMLQDVDSEAANENSLWGYLEETGWPNSDEWWRSLVLVGSVTTTADIPVDAIGVEEGEVTVGGTDMSYLLDSSSIATLEDVGRQSEDPDTYERVFYGPRVTWVTDTHHSVAKVYAYYVHGDPNNIMDQEKFNAYYQTALGGGAVYRLPCASVSPIERGDVEEAQEAAAQGLLGEIGLDQPWTSGDAEVDRYLGDPETFTEQHWDDYAEDEEEGAAMIEEEMEERIEALVARRAGDFGKLHAKVHDGHHRAFSSLAAGESYIFVFDDQLKHLKLDHPDVYNGTEDDRG